MKAIKSLEKISSDIADRFKAAFYVIAGSLQAYLVLRRGQDSIATDIDLLEKAEMLETEQPMKKPGWRLILFSRFAGNLFFD